MANAKKIYKTGRKVVKKIKKSKHKGIIIAFLIVILALTCFLGFEYYQEKANYSLFLSDIEKECENLSIPSQTESNLLLTSSYNDYNITWETNNSTYLDNKGTVNRPSYSEGDKKVTLSATFTYQNKTFLYAFIEELIGEKEIIKTFNVIILAKEPSAEELVDMAIAGIYMPEEVDYSIKLPKNAIKEGLSIEWTSSNESIITNEGVVTLPSSDTSVIMTALVKYQDYSKSESYSILVLSNEKEKLILDENFDSFATSSRYNTIENGNITYNNAIIIEDPFFDSASIDPSDTNFGDNSVKIRSNNESVGGFETTSLASIYTFSFNYIFNQAVGDDTYIEIYFNDNLIDKIIPIKSEDYQTYSHDFLGAEGIIKLNFVNNIKSYKYLIIDDIKVVSTLNSDDLTDLIMIPSSINRSIVLPTTTNRGGLITWESSDENIITNDGILNDEVKENKSVTLTATLLYRSVSKVFTFEINVNCNIASGDALKIYFIDIGEEDLGDCGESILLVYNDIDILVDAGDQKTSTYNGVKNAIMNYSNDQILDYVIATHPDSDHIGNMANVFKDFQVNNLIKFSGEDFTTQKFKNLKAAYDSEPNCNVYDIYNDIINDNNEENDYIYITSEIYIKFINTLHYLDSETNGRSIVFLLNVYNTKMLFTGDADNLSPHSDLESSYVDEVGDIDILKVVHHGTANGCGSEYLNKLKPEVAIICNGNFLGNKHGHPHVSTIKRLDECSSIEHIYAITGGGLHCEMTDSGAFKGTTTLEESKVDRNGLITLTIDGTGYSFSAKLTGENLIDLRNTTYYQSYLELGIEG